MMIDAQALPVHERVMTFDASVDESNDMVELDGQRDEPQLLARHA